MLNWQLTIKMCLQGTTINSVAQGLGTITAQGRNSDEDDSGFSFVHCKITGTGDTYLGRAWRQMPRVVFAYTEMGSLIDKEGWSDSTATSQSKEYAICIPSLIVLYIYIYIYMQSASLA
jgi:hypothetical protein